MPLLGAHMSVAGGLSLAFDRISKVKGQSLQIFTRNQRQWKAAPLSDEEISAFKKAWQQWGDYPVASHDSYLINLASPKAETAEKSIQAFVDELNRCEQLGIPFVVMHPGSHLEAGVQQGLERFCHNLDIAFAQSETKNVSVLVETTAGQGSGLGSRFEEIATIIDTSKHSDRLGVCFDTCHSFAAGYELRTKEGYEKTFNDFDRIIGLARLQLFHLNDSIKGLGSRVDRHTHIGQGEIGLEGFRHLMNDPRFANHPMVLETPKDQDLREDVENLNKLRKLQKI